MRRARVLIGSALVLGLGAGCAGTPKVPEVRDEWVARVPQEQMGPVHEARTSLRRTNDELLRADVALQDARRQLEVQQANRDAAGAQAEASKKALEAAQQTGDPARIATARQGLQEAGGGREVIAARIALAEARVKAAEAHRELLAASLAREQAAVEQAEYQALSAIGDTRVRDLRAEQFTKAVGKLGERERELQAEVARRDGEVASREQQLQQLESQQGLGGASTR